MAGEDVGRNRAMAKWGGEWLVGEVKKAGGEGKGLNVMTVCNTGSLATSVSFFFLLFFFNRWVDGASRMNRDMALPWDSSPICTRRTSWAERISHKRRRTIKVHG